ncbi:GNAT family N-acetyltransferase [Mesorhizobium sp. M1B.F.Ca.ET.045.04.1.1]|nr:GNAT family N-acetyltransferase [Mesorhizobium sp. M1B.F.Ca.ET.045.04.1.1]
MSRFPAAMTPPRRSRSGSRHPELRGSSIPSKGCGAGAATAFPAGDPGDADRARTCPPPSSWRSPRPKGARRGAGRGHIAGQPSDDVGVGQAFLGRNRLRRRELEPAAAAAVEIPRRPPRHGRPAWTAILQIMDWLKAEREERSVIADAHSDGEMIALIENDVPVAFLAYDLTYDGILEVRPDRRGLGYGKALALAALKQAVEDDRRCILDIQCAPLTSIPFWEKLGFRIRFENYAYMPLPKALDVPDSLRTAWKDGAIRPTDRPIVKTKTWRRRAAPLVKAMADLRNWFEAEPWRTGSELLSRLQAEYPGVYPELLRKLQRRLKVWRGEQADALLFGP